MNLSLFDLDNTLLSDDSDHLWGEFLVQNKRVDPDEYKRQNDIFHQQYLAGTLDIVEYQAFALKPLVDNSLEQLLEWREQFVKQWIEPKVAKRAFDLIKQRRAAGDTLVIITATNSFVAAPIAQLLGIENLIATEPEIVDGQYTGRIAGVPCFQDGKITRLNAWLESQPEPVQTMRFYSDSHNDLPLLKHADVAIAVDPDPKLAAEAKAAGWDIISLDS